MNDDDEPVDPNINSTSSHPLKNKSPIGLNLEEDDADTNEQILSAIEAVISQNNNKHVAVEEETEGMLFGKIIGRRLDGMDRKKRAKAQIEIQTLLFKYEFDE